MKRNVVGFSQGKECVGPLQRPLGFAMTLNMRDLVGCLELDNFDNHYQLKIAISFGFVANLVLDRQAYVFLEHSLGFLCYRLMVQSCHLLCNVFTCI